MKTPYSLKLIASEIANELVYGKNDMKYNFLFHESNLELRIVFLLLCYELLFSANYLVLVSWLFLSFVTFLSLFFFESLSFVFLSLLVGSSLNMFPNQFSVFIATELMVLVRVSVEQ